MIAIISISIEIKTVIIRVRIIVLIMVFNLIMNSTIDWLSDAAFDAPSAGDRNSSVLNRHVPREPATCKQGAYPKLSRILTCYQDKYLELS